MLKEEKQGVPLVGGVKLTLSSQGEAAKARFQRPTLEVQRTSRNIDSQAAQKPP